MFSLVKRSLSKLNNKTKKWMTKNQGLQNPRPSFIKNNDSAPPPEYLMIFLIFQ